jgi:hypothetical protein
MANEFIIKNGFHSKGDSQVSGSLYVSGSINSVGSTTFGDNESAIHQFTGSVTIDAPIFEVSAPNPKIYNESAIGTVLLGSGVEAAVYLGASTGMIQFGTTNSSYRIRRNGTVFQVFEMYTNTSAELSLGTNAAAKLGQAALYVGGNISGSGNMNIVGSVTSSFFKGDGSGLTNVPTSLPAGVVSSSTFPFTGDAQITGSTTLYRSGSVGDTAVFTIEGGLGTLFSVTDELSGSLFSVNDISGIPIFEVFSDDTVKIGTHNQEGIVVNGKNVVITGSLAIGALTGSVTAGRIDASNDVVAFSTSDRRWKDNITPIESPLEKLLELGGYEFDWREDSVVHGNKGHDVGVIAQEVESVLPEAVQTRSSGMKAVRYEKIIPLLIETIKEQQKQIDELKNRIK